MPEGLLFRLLAIRGGVIKGQKVLILGSAGEVGTFAVQPAKYFGCKVTGVCSTGNIQQTLSLGADEVIDYTKEAFAGDGRAFRQVIVTVNKKDEVSGSQSEQNRPGVPGKTGGTG